MLALDSVKPIPLRALPRLFVPGADPEQEIELPKPELDKLRKVLRLSPGAQVAILPGDGSLIRCELETRTARPLEILHPETEPPLRLTLAQALPKGDKLDEIVRGCTEIGVSRFILFSSDRTVVRWDERKLADRLGRLETIAREACEASFRTKLPTFEVAKGLADVLRSNPEAVVLSEVEGVGRRLRPAGEAMTIVVGPEGGWASPELKLIGDRGVSLGPRVLRVDHAGAAAAAILLLA
ncbi:MAG TPA: RsmE family RNA methyltransferase [Fimbriimonadaceae bacterium]|nr:RsmE family RNA methyltransferase [Fimbriimonadaceae bacterium]